MDVKESECAIAAVVGDFLLAGELYTFMYRVEAVVECNRWVALIMECAAAQSWSAWGWLLAQVTEAVVHEYEDVLRFLNLLFLGDL